LSKHVAVLMGGWSVEREVSLNSGAQCADALAACGYKVTRVDMQPDIALVLEKLKPDVAFLALHGVPGEDGTIQGLLELMRIPYTHSGVLSSALAMDKQMAKTILEKAGVSTPEGRIVSRAEAAKKHAMKPPYVLKPNSGGSSVGVFIVTEDMAHPPQELTRPDWEHGDQLLVETVIPGLALTCAVMGQVPLGVIEIVQNARFYDYESKYAPGGSKHILPARIKPNIYQEIQQLALMAHQALGCRGVTRSDFRFDPQASSDQVVCLEVNTQPGMTRTSLVPELAAHAGHSFQDLVRWILEDASCNR
jgi:D-alanine-D-alanine ligase